MKIKFLEKSGKEKVILSRGIIESFLNPRQEYGPIPFWDLHDDLKPDKLRFCLRELARKGCAGVFMHPRIGLEVDYLSEEWWKSIELIVAECKELGLKAWIYDEYNWPSGAAGGKVLDAHPEFIMPCLKSARVRGDAVKSFLNYSPKIVVAFYETAKDVHRVDPEEIRSSKRKFLLFYEEQFTDHTFGTTCFWCHF